MKHNGDARFAAKHIKVMRRHRTVYRDAERGVGKVGVPAVTRSLLPFYAVMVMVLFLVVYLPWLSEGLPVALGYTM